MKIKLCTHLIIFLVAIGIISGCSNSDDSENSEVTQIIDTSILTGDVNDPDFWSDNNLVWSDEFTGSSLSLDNWIPQRFLGGVGNTELQNYN